MAKEVVGVVQQRLDKATDKGRQYVVARIAGEGYFDWKGLTAENQVKRGDNVRLRVSDGRYRRIYDPEKLSDARFEGIYNGQG